MTKQTVSLFFVAAFAQAFLFTSSISSPILKANHANVQKRNLGERCFEGAGPSCGGYGDYGCGDYGCGDYGGDYGCGGCGGYGCGVPYSTNYNTASNSANQACGSQSYENSNHLAANICEDQDTAYHTDNNNNCANNAATNFNTICKRDFEERCEGAFPYGGHGYGSLRHGRYGYGSGHGTFAGPGFKFGGYKGGDLKKRDLVNKKRCAGGDYGCGDYGCGDYGCGGYGCGGYGGGYGGYGGCGCGTPYSANYNSASNSANQACGSQSYENSNHLAANICEDQDTAFCNSKDNACNSNACNNVNVIA